jgi:hypothetical protein
VSSLAFDRVAIAASALCTVHCVLAPFALAIGAATVCAHLRDARQHVVHRCAGDCAPPPHQDSVDAR